MADGAVGMAETFLFPGGEGRFEKLDELPGAGDGKIGGNGVVVGIALLFIFDTPDGL